jgi:muramoyltetrapeptide carboxypeptidase
MKRALKPTDTHPGDEVRIVAPSLSLAIIADDQLEIAAKRLTAHGLQVTFGDHARERDLFNSSSVASRIADLHAAFADPDVKGILTIIGGANANQLLDKLDYDLIAANAKIFCGYSDITALQNAILAKTGLVTYSGPHFSTYGMLKGNDYTDAYFCRCVMAEGAYSIEPSPEWSDDAWFRDQENRTFIPSTGWQIIQFGQATGTAIGGNLCTFNLLQPHASVRLGRGSRHCLRALPEAD